MGSIGLLQLVGLLNILPKRIHPSGVGNVTLFLLSPVVVGVVGKLPMPIANSLMVEYRY
jgi:enoyl-[acyl-carrier-protein] reductase (NADH)